MKTSAAQILRFGTVGVLNSTFGLGAIWGAMLLGASPLAANALGYGIGLALSYVLNRSWTFANARNDVRKGESFARFFIAFLLSWSLNILVVHQALHLTIISPYALQIAGMATYTITFFVLCRLWVFAETQTTASHGDTRREGS